jgi:hypothetical protein
VLVRIRLARRAKTVCKTVEPVYVSMYVCFQGRLVCLAEQGLTNWLPGLQSCLASRANLHEALPDQGALGQPVSVSGRRTLPLDISRRCLITLVRTCFRSLSLSRSKRDRPTDRHDLAHEEIAHVRKRVHETPRPTYRGRRFSPIKLKKRSPQAVAAAAAELARLDAK